MRGLGSDGSDFDRYGKGKDNFLTKGTTWTKVYGKFEEWVSQFSLGMGYVLRMGRGGCVARKIMWAQKVWCIKTISHLADCSEKQKQKQQKNP